MEFTSFILQAYLVDLQSCPMLTSGLPNWNTPHPSPHPSGSPACSAHVGLCLLPQPLLTPRARVSQPHMVLCGPALLFNNFLYACQVYLANFILVIFMSPPRVYRQRWSHSRYSVNTREYTDLSGREEEVDSQHPKTREQGHLLQGSASWPADSAGTPWVHQLQDLARSQLKFLLSRVINM